MEDLDKFDLEDTLEECLENDCVEVGFYYQLTGLIKGEFVKIDTDSKKVIEEVLTLMEDKRKEWE